MSKSALLDDTDRKIVALLRADARRSFQDIGQHVALSAPAVKRRVDRLEASGIIRGYTTVVDPQSFGWPTLAIVDVTTDGRVSAAEILKAIEPYPEVCAAYTVTGPLSAVLLVRTASAEHLEQVLEGLRERPGITRTDSAVVLSTLLDRPFGP